MIIFVMFPGVYWTLVESQVFGRAFHRGFNVLISGFFSKGKNKYGKKCPIKISAAKSLLIV